MGKNKDKDKDETPNPTSVTNRDILQRLNFLLSSQRPSERPRTPRFHPRRRRTVDVRTGTKEGDPPSRTTKSQRKRRRRVVSFEELSRSYVETMKNVGKKTNVKIDPSVKRRICKRCSAPLVPGTSATVRVKDSTSHGHLVSYRCHCCQAERRIPAPPASTHGSADGHDTSPTHRSPYLGPCLLHLPRLRKKSGPQPRLPPHFARDVGHIVFRGNERLDMARSIS
ncbi:RNAse P Rpr2/Rpp21/SNM1 subunit domain-containing protein [Boletus coccyginus]|nr:RNAse P Rpr2/Rpp21/SNM1 subunit domain-containing protein [Boletus coccyginus]